MLDNKIKAKMVKYNDYRYKADMLQMEIERYLEDNYMINPLDKEYSIDGEAPVYEWGTKYFDIAMIEKIIKTAKEIEDETGEYPDSIEIIQRMRENN